MPLAVYIAIYTVLALLVFLSVRYSVLAALLLALSGFVGLTVTFNAPKRSDKTIWVVNLLTVLSAAYLLVLA